MQRYSSINPQLVGCGCRPVGLSFEKLELSTNNKLNSQRCRPHLRAIQNCPALNPFWHLPSRQVTDVERVQVVQTRSAFNP